MSVIMKRKSIRQYTKEQVSDENITKMLKSGMQGPSAVNQQPWEFVVVRNRETLDQLSKVSKGAWMLSQAPLCIHVFMRLLKAVNLGVFIAIHLRLQYLLNYWFSKTQ